ncbi:MAG: 50S ribosomal protein L10, partial [Thermoplasmatales archaeon]|nr:50S ribosomal protein L10 [Candidatus Thermoplasmatota archaeon]MCG2826125.1 50S ribosomal protein L10 [Thermoplasmatales archaeon]
KKKMRGKISVKVVKNTLLLMALEEIAKKEHNVEKLKDEVDGQTAIITTNINPFKLYKEMDATKTKMPAKGGETAPEDIMVKSGETEFKPGPIVGELQKAGIPAAIEKGKVMIKQDKIVVKSGEKIPRNLAVVLTRLGIFPLTAGFDLTAVYENGLIFKPDVLAVDETKLRNDIMLLSSRAFSLAMHLSYITPLTVKPLIIKAHDQALSLSVNLNIPTKETIRIILSKAYSQGLALKSIIKEE